MFFSIATLNLLSLKKIRDLEFENYFSLLKDRYKLIKSSLQSFTMKDIPIPFLELKMLHINVNLIRALI